MPVRYIIGDIKERVQALENSCCTGQEAFCIKNINFRAKIITGLIINLYVTYEGEKLL